MNKLAAMHEAANRAETQVSTIQAISSSMRLNDLNGSTAIAETNVGGSYQVDSDKKSGESMISIRHFLLVFIYLVFNFIAYTRLINFSH